MAASDKRSVPCRQSPSVREPSESLQKFRRGETSLDEYLDQTVEVAVGRYEGILSSQDLELMRSTLRQHLRTDPIAVDMVRRVIGQAPKSESPTPEKLAPKN